MATKGIPMNVQRNHSMLRKRIPLHCQKKNISNGSLNATLKTGAYKNKIKTLLKNNRVLAVTLQNDRSKKEELLKENKANANIIMFSRLKLATLTDSLKQVVTVLDETLTLLQEHSSVSATKFTPKHTSSREEFKEKVKEVLMDSIPEEPEDCIPELPERKSNKKIVSYSNKNQNEDLINETYVLPEGPINTKKRLKPSNLNKRKSVKKNEIDSDTTINYIPSYKHCKSTAVFDNLDLDSPVKNSAAKFKKCSSKNKTLTSEMYTVKAETKPSTGKKSSKVTKEIVCGRAKEVKCVNKNKNVQNGNPSKNTSCESKWQDSIQIFDDIEMPEDNSKKRKKNQIRHSACILKNSVSPSKLHDNIVKNTNISSDCQKENVNPFKKQKLSARKFKSLGDFEVEPTVTQRTKFRNSALQSLSSNINIKKFKTSSGKGNVKLDDLVTIKQKSANLMLAKESTNIDTSKSYLQDLSLYQQEMVRNLAENTFLVAAEVHKSSEAVKTNKINSPIGEVCNLKQPIVLVKDIFKSGKSFCTSISHPAYDGLNGTALELQFLEHCSSLKMIPEESNHSQESSANSSAEVHKSSEPIKTDLINYPNAEWCPIKQPIVLVEDVFQSGKSFCKSISHPSYDKLNRIPLESQLIEHSSSLKKISEESNHSKNNSTKKSFDQTKNVARTKIKTIEPPLSVEEELIEQHKEKRQFRKRSDVCYKELPSNIKLRR